jgi:hypothetical protein
VIESASDTRWQALDAPEFPVLPCAGPSLDPSVLDALSTIADRKGVLLRNSRKTDSLRPAKSVEFLFRLAPPAAAFALLSDLVNDLLKKDLEVAEALR